MLHKNPTHHKGQWKYALLLPLLIAFVFIFNTKIIAQEKNSIEIKEINNSKAELVIDKNSNEESLKKEEAFFKKEFNINLSFKGIQRNSSNEITSIKIEAKGEKAQAKFENAGSEPIKPIKLSYDSEVNSISIGNLDRKKGNYSYITHEESDVELNGEPHENKNYIFVTSDGNKTKWITKEHHDSTWIDNKNKNKESKIIIIKSDKDKHKKENKIEFSSEEDSEIEVMNEGDESVYIIKTAGDKTIKQKISKKGDVLFISSDQEEPLYIIDGKEISADENDDIKQENIEKIEVFKGEKATEKYGDKGKNGVIIITTKKE